MRSARIVSALFATMLLQVSAAHAQRVDDIVLHISDAWSRGDIRDLVALSVHEGMAIQGMGLRTGPLGMRQAGAVLRRLFDERQTVAIRPGKLQIVGGSPRRAFAEITWITRAPDTNEPERATIFLELVLLDDRWQITQIRLLP